MDDLNNMHEIINFNLGAIIVKKKLNFINKK